jgi:hypothetical protein
MTFRSSQRHRRRPNISYHPAVANRDTDIPLRLKTLTMREALIVFMNLVGARQRSPLDSSQLSRIRIGFDRQPLGSQRND